jgi:type IV secretory pathway TraG/TraD family ATPase VirD4
MSTITTAELLAAAVALISAPIAWRRKDHTLAVGCAAGGLVLTTVVKPLLTVAVLVCAAAVAYHRWGHTAKVVTRWGARSRRKHGVASTLDIARHASWVAMRRKATTVRPSLAELTRRARIRRVRTHHVAVPLCRTGLLRVWASVEDVVLTFGRPRIGKTQWLIGRIIDAPGAVLVTSTRTDVYEQTYRLRQRNHRPVYVFNPTGLGGIPTTLPFDLLAGCTDPTAAYERATDSLSASPRGGADHAPWAEQARRVFTALLHAAALGKLSMHTVADWIAAPDKYRAEVLSLLRRSPSAAAYVPDAEQFLSTNERTRSSITSTIMPILGWLTSSTACAAVTGGQTFDVAQLLADRATVYLLGAADSQVAPLVSALTGLIARDARRIAARAPGGRLDPPLTLVLDEAALICPVPLNDWTADMGGRGVHIIAAFQSRAQLIDRWGTAAARVILNNAGAVVLFGLGADTEDLAHWAALAGERDERAPTHDASGRVVSRSTRRVPVISPAQLTNLPPGRVVVFVRGMPPVTGWAEVARKRRDVRRQARITRADAKAVWSAAEQFTAEAAGRASATSPIPTHTWVVDAQGVAHSTNGAHPPTGQTAQEAPNVTH